MLAVERTTRLFRQSLLEAVPGIKTSVSRSHTRAGRSHYVFIYGRLRSWKVRISDHPVGMRRAISGEEDLYISAGAKPANWAVWLSELANTFRK